MLRWLPNSNRQTTRFRDDSACFFNKCETIITENYFPIQACIRHEEGFMFTAIRGSRTTAPLRHALPDTAAVAFDALMAAADVTRDRELSNRKRRECSRLPLIISSLEIFTVPQPHVSPHTQGCKRWVQRVSRARGVASTLTATFSGQVQSFQGQVLRT